MKYTSLDAESQPRIVKPGKYWVTVVEAIETVSQSGFEMIKLRLEVEGHGTHLYDYLVASESSFWKIDTFRKSIGEKVIEGDEVELIAADLEGKRGYARLRVEEFQGKKSNKVDAWLSESPQPSKPPANTSTEADDNEPF